METPSGLICTSCYRSVDSNEGGAAAAGLTCVHCGGTFESFAPDDSLNDRPTNHSPREASPNEEILRRSSVSHAPHQSIERYQLRELLGTGGNGQVYRAFDPRLDRDVAIKVLKDSYPSARVVERFFREARAVAQFDHPNIVPLHDAGRTDGRCWIAYEYIKGSTLSRLRDEMTHGTERAVRIVRDLADAVDHAHHRGIFHRDLKPSNVMIDEFGRTRLTDFGLARRLDYDPTITREGAVLGTPAYMSPEQAAGKSHLADARSDVYSLGVMLYELLCGERPPGLPSNSPSWLANPEAATPPPLPRNPAIPWRLERICRRAMAFFPNDRYQDARALVEDLEYWLHSGTWMTKLRGTFALVAAGTMILGFLAGGITGVLYAKKSSIVPDLSQNPPTVTPPKQLIRIVPAGNNGPFFSALGSRFYHVRTCASIKRTTESSLRSFTSRLAAEAQGFRPCQICLPNSRATNPNSSPATGVHSSVAKPAG